MTTSAEKQKKFSLQCREIRLFISKNPGTNDFTIKNAVGYKVDKHLSKMLGMGIIKIEGSYGGGWYVVPQ